MIHTNYEKTIPKGTSKVMFLGPKWRHGLPGSTHHLIFDVLVRSQNIIIFGRPPDGPKNRTNQAVQRQRVETVTPDTPQRQGSRRAASPGSIESKTL